MDKKFWYELEINFDDSTIAVVKSKKHESRKIASAYMVEYLKKYPLDDCFYIGSACVYPKIKPTKE